jgi:CubicO group peptidase (beta-lactamase class C family)
MTVMIDAEPAVAGLLGAAIEDAIAHESKWSREPSADGSTWGVHGADPPPWNRLLGPVSARGPASGVLVHRGRRLARWGEPARADLTFSVAKTYLALLAGVAFDRGLIADPDEPIRARLPGIGFDSAHNASICWTHLLQQTSEWEGECFGLPDQVDRWRRLSFQPPGKDTGAKGGARPLRVPGTYWEYNDVRINHLSLALLHLFREPLPEVFRQAVMEPIGASADWTWRGYDNAWLEIDGRRMQSVPGGTHWGGGVTISSEDQIRLGTLLLHGGAWAGRQVVSSQWIARMLSPCAIAPFYGMLVWLNRTREVFPSAPASSVFAIGAGSSFTWVDRELDLVLVARWLEAEHADRFFGRIARALGHEAAR